ncbi:pyridoxal phosphate-dependent aminotransferase [Sulfitobacter aestuariivivens]|uniref:pyridoxal phosphate-dependent aminotransferase n=1 Tax=Sulfitobacter aestuariivivens TaxID=2766981 RepID=UPI003613573E
MRGRITREQPKGLPVVNLGFNELPYGPTPKVAVALEAMMPRVYAYGTPYCDALRDALGQANGLDPETIICGNGSEELLDVIARNFARAGDEILISAFGYIQFEMCARRQSATIVKAPEADFTTDVDALLGAITERTKLLFLANPNNPTGTLLPLSEVERLVDHVPPHIPLVLDLAYGEFVDDAYCDAVHTLARNRVNVIVTRTFSKAYGLAGLRVGWAHVPKDMLPGLYAARGMGSVNAVAQAAAEAALQDMAVVNMRVAETISERERVAGVLTQRGLRILPSRTNFLMVTTGDAAQTEALVVHLFEDAGLVVTRTREAGLEDWMRFSMGTPEQNDLLLASVARFLEEG